MEILLYTVTVPGPQWKSWLRRYFNSEGLMPMSPRKESCMPLSVFVLAAASLFFGVSRAAPEPGRGSQDDALKARAIRTLTRLPLHFEANQGQTDARVKFLARGAGYAVHLTAREVVITFQADSARGGPRRVRDDALRAAAGKALPSHEARGPRPANIGPSYSVLRMKFLGANPNVRLEGFEPLPGRSNYFVGNDRSKWRTNVRHYAKVRYEQVYPGIDVVYYGDGKRLEHDFIVMPGADPATIRIEYGGGRSFRDR